MVGVAAADGNCGRFFFLVRVVFARRLVMVDAVLFVAHLGLCAMSILSVESSGNLPGSVVISFACVVLRELFGWVGGISGGTQVVQLR